MNDLEQAMVTGLAPWDLRISELCNAHVTVFQDRFPVCPGHLLFVPNHNTAKVTAHAFELALRHGQRLVDAQQCEAFNIGINCGPAAGQTVMYPHVHLIPRRVGDCEDPVGGVRAVIPGQANYKSSVYKKHAIDSNANEKAMIKPCQTTQE